MSYYTPDSWVIVKLTELNKPPLYKILGGWSGGYLHGNSWRMNSGITAYKEDAPRVGFWGYTGSLYDCSLNMEGQRMSTSGIVENLQAQVLESEQYAGTVVEEISYEQFKKEFKETN